METKSYFTNIEATIQRELEVAQTSIIVAVAWLTAPTLFDALVRAAKRGVLVRIALQDDDTNRNSTLSMDRLTAANGHCYWIAKTKGTFHHKFCIIDDNVVITGSYNWTNYARLHNDENIMVINGNSKTVADYIQAFEDLLKKYGSNEPTVHNQPLPKKAKTTSKQPAIECDDWLVLSKPMKWSPNKFFVYQWLLSMGAIIGLMIWLYSELVNNNPLSPHIKATTAPIVSQVNNINVTVKETALTKQSIIMPSRVHKKEANATLPKPECNIKTVMSDDDYRACGTNPPTMAK